MTYRPTGIPDITPDSVIDALNAIKEIIEVREGVRGSDVNDAFMSINLLVDKVVDCLKVRPQDGKTGYFDDGANFRVTITNGIITGVAASSAAGFSVT
jgi:hypothetical protein